MPRTARKQSSSSIYHIMIRGNERKEIFHDDDDRIRFLNTLKRMKEDRNYEIYAYCLMRNHVHLLIKEKEDTIQRSMKRISVSYVQYFNNKYERIGHLLQDRFRSEVVEDDRYILAAARYIHNNPVKAGLSLSAVDYRWSSYLEYINAIGLTKGLVERDFLLSLFSNSKTRATGLFQAYTNESSEDKFIDDIDIESKACSDKNMDLEHIIRSVLEKGGYNLESLKRCSDKKVRNHLLKVVKESTGVSVRELSRLTGIGKDVISRVLMSQ